jgi:predicted phage terminase large subunit-like protein
VPKISLAEYDVITRNDFYTFIHRAFRELNPRVQFLPNWHIELMASKLEACRSGNCRRLIINVPPRSLKSHAAAVSLPAFLLGHNPSSQIICASYGQDLANKHSLDCRTLLASAWYRRLFRTRLASHKQSVQEFLTTENGFRLATSVQGVLTGRGADFIIIDDPLKPDEALSETQRNAVNNWYDHTLYSRLNDKQRGCIIIIMQRLHEDDLVGHVLEQEDWDVVRLPAIAEEDEKHVIQSAFGARIVHRALGEVLDPNREPLHVLEGINNTIGSHNFAGQYQQAPSPLGGGMVKLDWFMRYAPGEQPAKFDFVFQSWDTGNKDTELSDPSVCTTWGIKSKRLYLLSVYSRRLNYPDLKRAVREQAARFKPRNILIEDKASGTQLIQELIREGIYGITRYEPKMDKVMRLHSVTSTIENGFVYLPTEAPWLDAYLHEMTGFPKGKHDDQVDATSQALDWVKDQVFPLPLHLYMLRQALQNGTPLTRSMLETLDDLDPDPTPSCPACHSSGPARYTRKCRCNQCGQEWERPDLLKEVCQERSRCIMANGSVVEWHEELGFWIDVETGEQYPPGDE